MSRIFLSFSYPNIQMKGHITGMVTHVFTKESSMVMTVLLFLSLLQLLSGSIAKWDRISKKGGSVLGEKTAPFQAEK